MHALDAEMEHTRDSQAPGKARTSRDVAAQLEKTIDGPQLARQFSPDPMRRTDRYRLVTPYGLSPEDRSAD